MKDIKMKSVRITINGVRYDSQVTILGNECDNCDLRRICDKISHHANELCLEVIGKGYSFKRINSNNH